MALGVPVIATPDAVDGMELESGLGLLLVDSDEKLASTAVELLSAPERLSEQSRLARREMERLYSLENTYGRLMIELRDWLEAKREAPPGSKDGDWKADPGALVP
jgi:glycosyltransferase involved in cell wall biosynthesis